VVLKARERTRGACHPRSSEDTFSLQLHIVDEHGVTILDETRKGLKYNRRVRQERFEVTYTADNCAGSNPSSRRHSKSNVKITATTEDGKLNATRILKCKK
jgi:hypothetical protein